MSYVNFSKRNRAVKDSDTFKSPENVERTKLSEHMVKSFEDVKDKWREYCSYFRLTRKL